MVVEYRRENYASCDYFDMSFNDPEAENISPQSISFDIETAMPTSEEGTVRSWAERIAARHHEITDEADHFQLRHDLINHLWSSRNPV